MRLVLALVLTVDTVLVTGAGGCWNVGVICTANVVPGVVVRVTDARTGEGIGDAVLTLTEGDYTETLIAPGSPTGSYYGAEERPGTYTLTVTATGYVEETVEGIVVESIPFDCHVRTVELTVELRPAN